MQKIFYMLVLALSASTLQAQSQKFQLSTHILDIATGTPAPGVKITLQKQLPDKSWQNVSECNTDKNGRVGNFLPYSNSSNNGIYKLTFYTETYFKKQNQKTFFPFVEVVFEITDDAHYHVPITVSPYGYSTYRGS